LGFYWAVIAAALSATAAAIAAMAPQAKLKDVIVGILCFDGAIILIVLTGIFVLTLVDPTKLMLAQISGEEYIANRKLTMGDSNAGEHLVRPANRGEPSTDESGDGE
jgi:hypothetical protein